MKKNDKIKLRRFVREIIVGTIVSLVCMFIFTVGKNFLTIAYSASSSFGSIMIDVLYYSAAKVTNNTLLLNLFFIFLEGAVGIGATAIVDRIRYGFELKRNGIFSEKFNHQTEHDDAATININIKKLANQMIWNTVTLVLILVLVITFTLFYAIYPCIIKDKMDLTIEKITPYVEKNEIYKLRSDWVQMKSKDDYDKIINKVKTFEKIMVQNQK